jgi:hypothetical protein
VVLRPLGLGDLLTGVPAIRAVRAAVPGHRLVLATTAALEPLAALVDAVDEVLPARELEPLDWSGPPPELAVDLHGKGPASHVVVADLRPGGCSPSTAPATRADLAPRRARGAALVPAGRRGAGRGRRPRRARPRRARRAPARPGRCGAGAPGRGVPRPALARRPVRRRRPAPGRARSGRADHGGPAEVPLARAVAEGAGLGEGCVLAGRTTTLELAAVVSGARVVVSGDTGMAHLATAYRRPSVVLFGPVSPAVWGPPVRAGKQGTLHVVLWHGDGTGDPWGTELDPALGKITVDEVINALDDLLART